MVAYNDDSLSHVPWEFILDRLGLRPVWLTNASGKRIHKKSGALICCCFFHRERTPSLYLYPNGRWQCYGCRRMASTKVAFLMAHWGESDWPSEEALRLFAAPYVSQMSDPRQLWLPGMAPTSVTS